MNAISHNVLSLVYLDLRQSGFAEVPLGVIPGSVPADRWKRAMDCGVSKPGGCGKQ
jgi:hypothetical protein